MVQIKAETGGPAAAEHDVAGEFEEGSQLPPVAAAVFKGDLSASRDSKVHVKAKDGEPSTEPAAGLTYAERYVAGEFEEESKRPPEAACTGGFSPRLRIWLKSVAAS